MNIKYKNYYDAAAVADYDDDFDFLKDSCVNAFKVNVIYVKHHHHYKLLNIF